MSVPGFTKLALALGFRGEDREYPRTLPALSALFSAGLAERELSHPGILGIPTVR
jgi:hypothetical protein